MEGLIRNFSYAFRVLRKSPAFTAICVITLAIGSGATSMIFSLVNRILLQQLPYPDSQRLVALWGDNPELHISRNPVSYPNFTDWRAQAQTLEDLAAYSNLVVSLSDGKGYPERIRSALITANFFQVLRVPPSLGRSITVQEESGASFVAVISDGLWRRRFRADPAILKEVITVNSRKYAIIGVMPANFEYPKGVEMWLALRSNAEPKLFDQRGSRWLRVIGRLKPGTPLVNTQTEMATIAARLQQQYSGVNRGWQIRVLSLRDYSIGDIKPVLWSLMGAVLFVLLIACANVASLLLARNNAREAEMAFRLALGAKRIDILRQLLSEGFLMSLLGGTLGIALAYCGLRLLPVLKGAAIPRLSEVRIDPWVIGFTVALSILTALVFGMLPALRDSRSDLRQRLGERQAGSLATRQKRKLCGLLVIVETGLSLVLLVGAGLLIKSFLRLRSVDPGFNPDQLLTFSIDLDPIAGGINSLPKLPPDEFYRLLSDRLKELPGVEAVGIVTTLPMTGSWSMMSFHIQGRPLAGQEPQVTYDAASPGYFQTMRIPLLRGRYFTEQDTRETASVVIINQQLASEFFPAEDPVGKYIIGGKGGHPHEIVGIVKNVKHDGLYVPDHPAMYVPIAQDPWRFSSFVIRTEQKPQSISREVQQTVWNLNKSLPVSKLVTMNEIVSTSIVQQQLSSLLLGSFAGIALLLAAIGLYGTMSYSVSLRTHEIGIRMALGAQGQSVRNMILKEGLYLALGGTAGGLLGALLLTRFLKSMLFGIGQTDPTMLCLATAVLFSVAVVACYVPARRATKVDPLIALRRE